MILVKRNTAFLQEDGDKEQKGNINNNIQKLDMWYSVTMSPLGQ